MFVGQIEYNDCIARVMGFHNNRAAYVTKYLSMFVCSGRYKVFIDTQIDRYLLAQ